mmetsp:Transcript_23872/g.74349  ORF Transcript_23872/g.74349 Transcript_23872/m.74349 type:complete len:93 (-) Transcript_23872:2-280(-)
MWNSESNSQTSSISFARASNTSERSRAPGSVAGRWISSRSPCRPHARRSNAEMLQWWREWDSFQELTGLHDDYDEPYPEEAESTLTPWKVSL